MSIFFRLLRSLDKQEALKDAIRNGGNNCYEIDVNCFHQIDGAPFAYWVSDEIRNSFSKSERFGSGNRKIKVGVQTGDDFRFVRTWWEIVDRRNSWMTFAKGGSFSQYYAAQSLLVNWDNAGSEISNFFDLKTNKLRSRPQNVEFCFLPGLTWSDRTTSSLSARIWPAGGVFSVKGSCGFFAGQELFACAVMNSRAFNYLIGLLVGAGDAAARSYQVGTIGKVPYPQFDSRLEKLASTSWSLKRQLDSTTETSHAFLLPAALRSRLGPFDREAIQRRLKELQAEVDEIAFELFRFSDADRRAALDEELGNRDAADESTGQEQDDDDDDLGADATDFDALMSWSVGVAFGRFDWRIATYEREGPPEPDPFEPVPPKSPAMPLDGTQAFFVHSGILVGDSGHSHDLARLVEDVLRRIDHPVPDNVSKWLQTELFPLHLKLYSKSRRKSPIYWPLSTASGGYTLWLYCPDLNRQTLYTAVNEFVEPKLEQTGSELATLRNKGNARSRDEDRALEALLTLERELVELRDILLQIAPTYCPNHDDGVQITAAPLWLLFRHKPWQKLLKETWGKLEKGDYDWSHLAMAYWPGRVREKCKADKSLAIAHRLEELYEPPPENATGAGRGGRKRRRAAP